MPRKNRNARVLRSARAPEIAPVQTPAARARTAAEDKLWAALRANPGSTAAELALAAGIGKSTAGKILATWDNEGSVTRTPGSSEGRRRVADRWAIAENEDAAEAYANEEKTKTAGDAGASIVEASQEMSGEAPPATAESAVDDVVGKTPAAEAGAATRDGTADTTAGSSRRLGKGELRGMVEDFLNEHPGEQFSPNAIGKALTRSAGAVNNALEKLVADGYAVQTEDKPKRFAAKPQTDEATN